MIHLPDEEATVVAGRGIAGSIEPGDLILLSGELGSGKTTFVRGIAEGLGWKGPVASPTFTLVRIYATNPVLFHVDLYRVRPEDAWGLSLEEARESGAAIAVEWAERLPEGIFPGEGRIMRFTLSFDGDGRGLEGPVS